MKKTVVNIMSFFIILVSVVSISIFSQETEVSASVNCTSDTAINTGSCQYVAGSNSATISGNGVITIKYTKGLTELMIYAVSGDKHQIIHRSGKYGEDGGTITIRLSSYFDYDTEVVIKHVSFNFIDGDNPDRLNEGDYYPIYCVVGNTTNCPQTNYIRQRITKFKELVGAPDNVEIDNDSAGLVYKGPGTMTTEEPDTINKFSVGGSAAGIKTRIVKGAGDNDNEANQNIEKMIFDDIIPALLIILGIAAALVGTILGYQIIKSADEPQARQEKISQLKNIIIGIIMVFIILLAAEPVTDLVRKYLVGETTSGKVK